MYECSIIEIDDFGFNHFIHHINESEGEHFGYSQEFGCIDAITDCVEEIIWR